MKCVWGRGLSDLLRPLECAEFQHPGRKEDGLRQTKRKPQRGWAFPNLPDPGLQSTNRKNTRSSDSVLLDSASLFPLPFSEGPNFLRPLDGAPSTPRAPPSAWPVPQPPPEPSHGRPQPREPRSRLAPPPPNGGPGARQDRRTPHRTWPCQPSRPPRCALTDRRKPRSPAASTAQNSWISLQRAAAAAACPFCCHGFSWQPAKPDANTAPPCPPPNCAPAPPPNPCGLCRAAAARGPLKPCQSRPASRELVAGHLEAYLPASLKIRHPTNDPSQTTEPK